MMRDTAITILLIVFFAKSSYCQYSLNYNSKWQIRPNFGINIPINNLLGGHISDDLFEYDDNSVYWQILSVSYFFHKRWGIEFNFQGMTSRNVSKKADNFMNRMESDYEDNYYVTPSTGASYGDFNLFSGNFERGLIGLIYRYERNRIFLYPKFSIGVGSFYTHWGNAILKERNSNNLIKVSYDSGKRPNDHFTTGFSTAFGYKLSKRFYVNAEMMASHYKANITFVKTTTDLNTNISTKEKTDYDKNILTLSCGGGLIYVIK